MAFIALQLAFNFAWGVLCVLFLVKGRKLAAALATAAAVLFSVIVMLLN